MTKHHTCSIYWYKNTLAVVFFDHTKVHLYISHGMTVYGPWLVYQTLVDFHLCRWLSRKQIDNKFGA